MNCSVCGQPKDAAELIQLGGQQVCAACKPLFIQRLKEGVLAPPMTGPGDFAQSEMGVGALLAASWQAWRQDWLTITFLTLLVAVPINLLLTAVDPGDEAAAREQVRYFQRIMAMDTLIGIFASLGIAHVVSERRQGRAASLGGALALAARRYVGGVGTGILAWAIIVLLLLALVVPGVIWLTYYSFAFCAVALRGLKGKRALDCSKSLVVGRWWAVLGRIVVLNCVVIVAAIPVIVAVEFAPASTTLTLGHDVFLDCLSAFAIVGTTILFLNLEAVGPRAGPDFFGSLGLSGRRIFRGV